MIIDGISREVCFADFAYSHHPYLSLFVNVYVKFVHFRILPEAKIMKIQQYPLNHLWSNDVKSPFSSKIMI